MTGKNVVFITGGSSGIGAYLAREYLKRGSQVYVCGRREQAFQQEFAADQQKPFLVNSM
jgi:short-subunit dehydrogenase involved in D-alanine esterification of teichoic acids